METVASALENRPREERALVGVSGGADSVALLHLLRELGFTKLIVAHLHHGLRGRAADADARFVEKLAATLKLPFVSERADLAPLRASGLSLETAARQARYEFFARIARRRRCATLYLAHQADDQAETFLFNLLRGSGLGGLSAMQPISERGKLRIVRPFLGVWRAEIVAFLAERGLKFREDASNRDLRHTRNRLRHEILPQLEQSFGREVRGALWRAAEIASADHAFIAEQVPAFPAGPIAVAALRQLPRALARRAVLLWLRAERVADVSFADVEAALALIAPEAKHARLNLAGGRFLRRRAGKLFVE